MFKKTALFWKDGFPNEIGDDDAVVDNGADDDDGAVVDDGAVDTKEHVPTACMASHRWWSWQECPASALIGVHFTTRKPVFALLVVHARTSSTLKYKYKQGL